MEKYLAMTIRRIVRVAFIMALVLTVISIAIVGNLVDVPIAIIFAVSIVLLLIPLCIFTFPKLLIPQVPDNLLEGQDNEQVKDLIKLRNERLKLQNDVRTTLIQGLGGAFFLLTAFLTWQQLQVGREGQITERFTRAIDQIGSERLDVRIGGIYALERIARDSTSDRATVVEVLTTFVRQHSRWTTKSLSFVDTLRVRKPDVQAAMTVLGRREHPQQDANRLDLSEVDLRRTDLLDAHLEQADLFSSHLQGTDLFHASLQGANLRGANLGGDVPFEQAYLEGSGIRLQVNSRGAARLIGAHLEGATLVGADLRRADFRGAYLNGADFRDARVDGANFNGATADSRTKWPRGFNWVSAGILVK
jgi:Pentapeptide repeats (8 copies)